jgi:putative transposase
MYAWRHMSEADRREVIEARVQRSLPWHGPPHPGNDVRLYHVTAACYGHANVLTGPSRLTEFEDELLSALKQNDTAEVRAWVILPDHYHILLKTELPQLRPVLHRLHNRTSTRWNGEDGERGRKVWHAFADRFIRGDIHYYRTINYIHANPVKHGHVDDSNEWVWSSLAGHLHRYGREELSRWWADYPIDGYGAGWDD